MKECPSCQAKNRDDATFCTECGADLREVATQADEWSAAAKGLVNKAKEGAKKAKEVAAAGVQKARDAVNTGTENVQRAMDNADAKAEAAKAKNVAAGGWDTAVETQGYTPTGGTAPQGGGMLVDQSESIVATIGSNYLQNFLSGGSVEKSVGVLTTKRFYYKGRNFSGTGKAMKSTTEEGVVSIEDVTFTMFSHTRHIGLLVFAVLLTFAAIILLRAAPYNPEFGAVALVGALVFYILFFVKRQTLFLVSFPGGGFAFDIRYYPIADIRDFQRQLHLLKDHRKEGGDA